MQYRTHLGYLLGVVYPNKQLLQLLLRTRIDPL